MPLKVIHVPDFSKVYGVRPQFILPVNPFDENIHFKNSRKFHTVNCKKQ